MNPTREEALFALALKKPADKRPAFLDAIYDGDAALRHDGSSEHRQSLGRGHDRDGTFAFRDGTRARRPHHRLFEMLPQREAMELMRHSDPRLTAGTNTDASLLSLKTAIENLMVLPPQMAPQILGAAGQSVSQPVAVCPQVQADETIANKGEKSPFGVASPVEN